MITTLLNTDCLKYLYTLDDKSFDIVIADPPYGTSTQQASGTRFKAYGGAARWNFKVEAVVFEQLLRVSKYLIVFGANNYTDILPQSSCWIVWSKPNIPKSKFSISKCELAWSNLPGAKVLYIEHSSRRQSQWAMCHPTAKPYGLYMQLFEEISYILKTNLTGLNFLDPYLGCGLSLIAAEQYGMNSVGVEIDPEYYEIAWTNQQRKLALF